MDQQLSKTLKSWTGEKTAAYLATATSENEPDPKRAAFFREMAACSERQATKLAEQLESVPDFHPSMRTRVVAFLLRMLPPRMVRNIMSAQGVHGMSVYRCPEMDPAQLPAGKRGHPLPTTIDEIGKHHSNVASGALRAGVFGVNDGLVSNTCLVMGVAGAGIGASEILLTGVAGLLAGAFSMAAGEFISMLSQREMFEYQLSQEKDEIERYPQHQTEELAIIFAARGVPEGEAQDLAKHIMANPKQALDVLAREELGLNPDELGSPPKAAISSFVTFSVGACVPLVPYLMGYDKDGIVIAAVFAGIALFAVGSAMSLFSGKSALFGGARMLVVGSIAAAATYSIGSLLGASVS